MFDFLPETDRFILKKGPSKAMQRFVLIAACASIILVSCAKKSEINRQLVAAVTRGDITRVMELLSSGADPDAREENNPARPALIIAAEEDNPEIAAALLNKNADVNAKSADGSSALMGAAAEGNLATLRLLLSRGAEVNAMDNTGQTALIRAAVDGQREAAEALVDSGADINIADRSGQTALMKAMINGHEETADLLLRKGAKLTAEERIIVDEAARSGDEGEEVIDSETK